MPETAVNKDSDMAFRKPEVWLASDEARVHLPAANSTTNESESQSSFRRTVTR